MWSVRMRAEDARGEHVSGAEGIFDEAGIDGAVKSYTRRALSHPKGRPHEINITVERLRKKPALLAALPLCTLLCRSPREAMDTASRLLTHSGVSEAAIGVALGVLRARRAMSGAAIIDAEGGKRLDGSGDGVRATRLGITRDARARLSRRLGYLGINTPTVIDALVLATKVAASDAVMAEICISDDPHYTTGYVASSGLGYVRLPNIKKPGDRRGGRVFLVRPAADMGKFVGYLKETPVIVAEVSGTRGAIALGKLLGE